MNTMESIVDNENLEVITKLVTARDAFAALCNHHRDTKGI